MTCIAAVIHGNKVWMGGDSLSGDWYGHVAPRSKPKVIKKGSYLIGSAGSVRMSNLLQVSFTPPEPDPRCEVYTFMVQQWVESLKHCFKTYGYGKTNSGEDSFSDSGILVGFNGQLFEIQSDYQVNQPIFQFAAIGSGADIALGALCATE